MTTSTCDMQKASWCAATFATAGMVVGTVGFSSLARGIDRSSFLDVAKKINEVCCQNMTGQPTAACQAIFVDPIKLDKSFMKFICQHAEEDMGDLPERISFSFISGGILTGITALSL